MYSLAKHLVDHEILGVGESSGATTLDGLTDVTLASPSSGQVLKYDGSEWVNGTVSGSGDVVGPSSATDGHIAVFDGVTGKLIADGGPVPTGGSTVPSGTVDGVATGTKQVFYNEDQQAYKIFDLGAWITLAQVSFDSLWDSNTDTWDSATMTWDSPQS